MLQAADLAFAPTSAPEEIRRLAGRLIEVPATGLLGPMLAAA
jgi:hypothetical protein